MAAMLARTFLSMNGEILYCTMMQDRGGVRVFDELTAQEFAEEFRERSYVLLTDYWQGTNKVPSIRYKVRLLRKIIVISKLSPLFGSRRFLTLNYTFVYQTRDKKTFAEMV